MGLLPYGRRLGISLFGEGADNEIQFATHFPKSLCNHIPKYSGTA